METPIFYQLKGTAFRRKGDDADLIEVNEIFKDDNPIIARENVFAKYQSYIDVFLDSKGLKYVSHEKTFEKLQDFFNSFKREYFKPKEDMPIDIELDLDTDKGLYIYMITSDAKEFKTLEGDIVFEDKDLIHYIDKGKDDLRSMVLTNLMVEHDMYKEYKLETKDYIINRDAVGEGFVDDHIKLLKTPMFF